MLTYPGELVIANNKYFIFLLYNARSGGGIPERALYFFRKCLFISGEGLFIFNDL